MKYIDNIDFSKIKTHSDIGQSEVDGLDVVKEAMDLKNLVDNPKKLQTHDTHISPDEAYYKLATGATDEYLIKIVAQDPKTAYKYAKYEINDRFPLGEPVIAKDEKYSYWYAKYVLKGPFPLGEPAIAKSASYSYLYAEYVLKGPFPLGEPAIAKSAVHSLAYAKDVLKGPFPLGEPEIYRSEWKKEYEKDVLKGRPWTGLDQKVDEALDLKNLVSDPKKLQTHHTHISPEEAYERLKNGETDEYLIRGVAKDAEYSYIYARYVLEKPFPLGEPAIAKDAYCSYLYAKDILEKPWPLGEPAMAKDRNVSVVYARDVLKGPFPLAEPNIYNDVYWRKYYEKEVLKGRPWTGLDQQVTEALDLKNLVDDPKKLQTYDTHISPDEAYYKLATGATDEYLIKIVAQDPQTAYKYAKYEINDRFPLGEPAIAKNAEYSYYYAYDILKKPFPLGEPAIAKYPGYSYNYARDVLKKRFPLGEPAISNSAKYSCLYAIYVLKKRFPLGEPTIAKSALHSLAYAKDVLKGPFPLGEPAIYKTTWRTNYETGVLKGRPWTGLDKKIDEAMDLKSLVDDPNKLQTKDTHLGPKDALKKLKFGATDSYLYDILAQDPHIVVDYVDWYYTRRQFEGEPFANSRISKSIATSPGASLRYAEITNKPFAEGEPAIARDYLTSYYYARDILKGPFPLGEPAIYNSRYKDKYEMKVLRGKPWTGLDQKVTEALDLKNLVDDPKKLQTYDTHISSKEAYKRLENGEKDEYLIRGIAKDAGYSYLYARDVLKKRFPLGEPAISNSAKYSCLYAIYVLKKRFPLGEPAIAKSAVDSFFYAKDVLEFKPFSLGEPAIAKDGWYSYLYARDVLKKPWPLGEPAIAKDAMYSYRYEKYVLKGKPWTGLDQKVDEAMDLKNLVDDPKKLKTYDTHISTEEAYERILKGEKDEYLIHAIAKNAEYSYLYAIDVLEKPFPLGEPAIAKSAVDSYHYAMFVLKKKPFPLGEPAIARSAYYAYQYARNVLKGPFPLGEPEIYKDPDWKRRYVYYVLQRTPWTNKDQKVDEAMDLKKLVSNPTKLQTYHTHIQGPKEAYERLAHGEKYEYLFRAIATDAYYSYKYVRYVLENKPFPLGEPAIAKDEKYSYWYAKYVLKKPFPLGEPAIAKNAYYSYDYAKNILNKPWPPGEPEIAKVADYSFDYAKNVLKGPFPLGETAIARHPDFSYEYARDVLKGPFPLGEKWISREVKTSYGYAKNVLKGPFPLGEPAIAKNASYSYAYARYVLEKPFPLGEPAFAKCGMCTDNDMYSYLYAKEVLKGPFPLGEPTIAKSPYYSYDYAKNVLKGPFPLGEPAIAKDGRVSYEYAFNVLKGPFPLGEPAIYKHNSSLKSYYKQEVLKDRPWTGLDQKVDEALDLKNLVDDPTKLKTHDTHISPDEALERLLQGETDEYLVKAVAINPRTAIEYAESILKGPFPEGEPAIAKNADYSFDYARLIGRRFELGEPAMSKDGLTAYVYAKYILQEPWPLGEPSIASSKWSQAYERTILQGRPWTGLDQKVTEAFDLKNLVDDPKKLQTYDTHISLDEALRRLKEGEKNEYLILLIAKDAEYSYFYAADILKKRFPLGEPAIAKDAKYSCLYAIYVLEKPFPLGEPAIAKSPRISHVYALHVLKGPFPLGEPTIAKYAHHSYFYAKDVLKKPFPLGEPTIAKDEWYSHRYSKNVLKDQPWTGLDQKVTEAFDLKNLVDDPKKLQTYDTHISPKEAYEKLKAGELDGIYFKAVSTDPFYSLKTAIDVLEGPFPLGEPAIATSSSYSLLYALNVLKDRFILGEPSIATIPYNALEYARRVIKGPFPLAEPTFATSAGYSFMYAKHILHGPFPLGEKAIYNSEDTGWLHRYVNEITKGRPWTGLDQKVDEAIDLKNLVDDPKKLKTHDTHISPKEAYRRLKKGETDEYLLRAVAKDAEYSFHYAADVLKKSFPLGEPTIAKDAGYSCLYAVEVLKGPFPLGEPIIATDTEYSLFYAMDALKGPFPLGEPAIKQNARIASRYRHFLRTLKNKKKTVKEAIDLKKLVDDPKKLKTHKTHISPKEAYERLENGEKDEYLIRAIAKSGEFSYRYAAEILKKRFPLGEPAIAKNADYSCWYAEDVLKGPFPLGEPVIARDPNYSFDYANDTLKGPFALGEPAIAKEAFHAYRYAKYVLKNPFPLGEPAIYKTTWKNKYETDVLKGRPWTNIDQKVDEALDLKNLVTNPKKLQTYDTHISPQEALKRLQRGETNDYLVKTVAKSIRTAYMYARYVIHDRFPLGEPMLAKHPQTSYLYAKEVLNGPFPLGEPIISTDGDYSYYYALDVIKGPWPPGEPAIAKNAYDAYKYAKHVLNGPFPLGEPVIARVPNYSFDYAKDVLKGPFPLAEPAISQNVYFRKWYEDQVLKGRPWTGLDSDKQ